MTHDDDISARSTRYESPPEAVTIHFGSVLTTLTAIVTVALLLLIILAP